VLVGAPDPGRTATPPATAATTKKKEKLDDDNNRADLLQKPYHAAVVKDELPLSIGGGIGISRLVMLLLQTAHVGEVSIGVWHDAHFHQAKQAGIDIIPDRLIPGIL